MFKSLLGIAPQAEEDGSFRPSKLALKLATSDTTNYEAVSTNTIPKVHSRILVVFTEQKNMTMQNGRKFSTGNHPVEALVPMLHLQNAGFEFEIATPTGKPVVFEMWAMPMQDEAVMGLYNALKGQLEHPTSLKDIANSLPESSSPYAAIFVPGGHGAMLGIPQDSSVGSVLRWAHRQEIITISICHGPGALLATALDGHDFPYAGYEMAVFPDSIDKQTPWIGYLPGHMPWQLGAQLEALGANIVNTKGDDTCVIDRTLITGASPDASQKLGVLATKTLLDRYGSTTPE